VSSDKKDIDYEAMRSDKRFDVRLSMELVLDGRAVTGATRNVSLGGVCVELERKLQEKAYLRFNLFLVEEEIESVTASALDLTGTVQWTAESENGYAAGIKFANLTNAQKAALEARLKNV
jgi:hypothetical protein